MLLRLAALLSVWLFVLPTATAEDVDSGVIEADYTLEHVPQCTVDVASRICVARWDSAEDSDVGNDEVYVNYGLKRARVSAEAPGVPSQSLVLDSSEPAIQHPGNQILNDAWIQSNSSLPPIVHQYLMLESRPTTQEEHDDVLFITAHFPTVQHPVSGEPLNSWAVPAYSWECDFYLGSESEAADLCSRDEVRPLAANTAWESTDHQLDEISDQFACGYFGVEEHAPQTCPTFDSTQSSYQETLRTWKDTAPNLKTKAHFGKVEAQIGPPDPEVEPQSPSNATWSESFTAAAPTWHARHLEPAQQPIVPETDPLPPVFERAPERTEVHDQADRAVAAKTTPEATNAWVVVAVATAATGFLLAAALALYHRVTRTTALVNANRRRILETVRDEPGLRAGTIATKLGLDRETVVDHLRVLESAHHVQSTNEGHRRYFVNGGTFTPKEQAAIIASSLPIAKEILAYLGREGETDLPTMCDALRLPASTASRTVKRLEAAGLVTKRHAGRRLLLRLAGQRPTA